MSAAVVAVLDALVRTHAAERGDQPALVRCGRSETALSWAALGSASDMVAARLSGTLARHLRPCVVVELTEETPEELVALVAALRVPAPVALVDGRRPGAQDAVRAALRTRGCTLVPAGGGPVEDAGSAVAHADELDGRCLLLATGGSTGHPKIVIDRLLRAAPARPAAVRHYLATGFRPGQRQLACSSLHHVAGLGPFVEGLAAGATQFLLPVFDPARAGTLVDDHDLDWLQMTPFHMTAVLSGPRPPARWRRTPRLLHMSAHCPARVKRAFHAALDPARVHEIYGASEGLGMTMARGDEWEARPGTVGRGFLTSVRVAGPDGRWLLPHRTGEVYMRSPASKRLGYVGEAGRLRATPDGFRTLGDVGHLDEDGYLYLRPRQIATITVAGVTINPAEVEAELSEHPRIADVAVCGIPSPTLGERVTAVVVRAGLEVAGGPDEAALRRWAAARLQPAQVPSRWVFAAALPRTPAGKIDRAALFASVNNGCTAEPTNERG